MGIFDLFKKKSAAQPAVPVPGPDEKIVVFNDLGMH
jgi:hypothetical protein